MQRPQNTTNKEGRDAEGREDLQRKAKDEFRIETDDEDLRGLKVKGVG